MKWLPYILIAVLLIIVLLQNQCNGPKPPKETRDTVIVYVPIHDTIPGKPLPPIVEKDTVWLTRTEFIPDTTYAGLLRQYNFLGNNYFEKRTFSTTFPIADYGSVTSIDTVKENKLIGTTLITELNIPVTTIVIEKEAPLKTRLYYGISVTGTKSFPINGIYGDLLLKTKNDKLYSLGVGWNGEVAYKGGIHWPLRFK